MLRVLVIWEGERVPGLGAVFTSIVPRAFFIYGVKIRGVHGVADLGNVGGWLLPNVSREINGDEEWVGLQVVGPVPPQPVVSSTAQFDDEVPGLGAQLDLGWNVERVLPVYHLNKQQNQRLSFSRHLKAHVGSSGTIVMMWFLNNFSFTDRLRKHRCGSEQLLKVTVLVWGTKPEARDAEAKYRPRETNFLLSERLVSKRILCFPQK